MWDALKLLAKFNGILKNHLVTWFTTGKLSPWKIFNDLIKWVNAALTAKGYKKVSELKQESQKIQDMLASVDGSVQQPKVSPEKPTPEKPKPQKRTRHGRLI